MLIICLLNVNYRQLFWIILFTSCALHYYLDQDYVGSMSHKKLFSLSLTYSRTSRIYAWGCWYVSNVCIIFDWSMLVLWCCHMFLISYYIILRNFIELTYWQDAQCQFPVFALFFLQKVTSGNILGIGWKFTGIFYWTNEDRSQKGSPGGSPQARGDPQPRAGGGRGHHPPLALEHFLEPLLRL